MEMEIKNKKKTIIKVLFVFDIFVILFSAFLILRSYNVIFKSNKKDDVAGESEVRNDIQKDKSFTFSVEEVDFIDSNELYVDPSIDDVDFDEDIGEIPGGDVDINSTYDWNTYIPTSTSYKPFVNGTQRNLKTGDCMKRSNNCVCPTVGNNKGFFFTIKTKTGRDMKETYRQSNDKIVKLSYGCSGAFSGYAYVNKRHKEVFKKAYKKLCQIVTSGIDGYKYDPSILEFDGTLSERTNNARTICSNHAYGSAIDLNAGYSVKVNGVTHRPYGGDSSDRLSRYNKFIKAIGGENKKKNINYILWKKVFKPSGFTKWGGDWSGHFDPMHYEIS